MDQNDPIIRSAINRTNAVLLSVQTLVEHDTVCQVPLASHGHHILFTNEDLRKDSELLLIILEGGIDALNKKVEEALGAYQNACDPIQLSSAGAVLQDLLGRVIFIAPHLVRGIRVTLKEQHSLLNEKTALDRESYGLFQNWDAYCKNNGYGSSRMFTLPCPCINAVELYERGQLDPLHVQYYSRHCSQYYSAYIEGVRTRSQYGHPFESVLRKDDPEFGRRTRGSIGFSFGWDSGEFLRVCAADIETLCFVDDGDLSPGCYESRHGGHGWRNRRSSNYLVHYVFNAIRMEAARYDEFFYGKTSSLFWQEHRTRQTRRRIIDQGFLFFPEKNPESCILHEIRDLSLNRRLTSGHLDRTHLDQEIAERKIYSGRKAIMDHVTTYKGPDAIIRRLMLVPTRLPTFGHDDS